MSKTEITDDEIDALLAEFTEECTEVAADKQSKASNDAKSVEPTPTASAAVAAEKPTAAVTAEKPTAAATAEDTQAATVADKPTAAVTAEKPIAAVAAEKPTAAVTAEKPTAAVAAEKPTTAVATEKPTAAVTAEKPTAAVAAEKPTTVVATEKPAAAIAAEKPTAAAAAEKPTAAVAAEKPTAAAAKQSKNTAANSNNANKKDNKNEAASKASDKKPQSPKIDDTKKSPTKPATPGSQAASAKPGVRKLDGKEVKVVEKKTDVKSEEKKDDAGKHPGKSVLVPLASPAGNESADLALAAADRSLERSRSKSIEKETTENTVTKLKDLDEKIKKEEKVKKEEDVKKNEAAVAEEKKLQPESPKTSKGGGGGWGWGSISAWGSSVLSSASAITTQVGDSMVHVLEAVESSLVEPMPVVSSDKENKGTSKKKKKGSLSEEPEDEEDNKSPVGGVSETLPKSSEGEAKDSPSSADKKKKSSVSSPVTNQPKMIDSSAETAEAKGEEPDKQLSPAADEVGWFQTWHLSQLTGAVQKQGKSVMGKGLQALEIFGKKTMGVINQVLDEDSEEMSEERTGKKKKMSVLMKHFDECMGVVHFEALKSLSQMSADKLNGQLMLLSADNLDTINVDLALVSQAFDLGDVNWESDYEDAEHDYAALVTDFIDQLSLNVKTTRLLVFRAGTVKWLESCKREQTEGRSISPLDVHGTAISMLAELTANGVAMFHKIAQLLLIDTFTPVISYKLRALCLAGPRRPQGIYQREQMYVTYEFTRLAGLPIKDLWVFVAPNKFLKAHEPTKIMNKLVRNLVMEASNCCTCLQDSFNLILPIMHLALARVHPLCIDNSGIPHLEGLQVISSMSKITAEQSMARMKGEGGERGEGGEVRERIEEKFRELEALFDLNSLLSPDSNKFDKVEEGSLQDLYALISDFISVENIKQATEKLHSTKEQINKWVLESEKKESSEETKISANDIHQKAVQYMCQYTACAVEIYHCVAQYLLSTDSAQNSPREKPSTPSMEQLQQARVLISLTRQFCRDIGCQSTMFTRCITGCGSTTAGDGGADKKVEGGVGSVTPLITNIYLEASNNTTCIQDAYLLMLPILKLSVIKRNHQSDLASRI